MLMEGLMLYFDKQNKEESNSNYCYSFLCPLHLPWLLALAKIFHSILFCSHNTYEGTPVSDGLDYRFFCQKLCIRT